MGGKFHMYGFEILQKLFTGEKIEAVERFPRITMCKYILRTRGDNIQSYDVQCLLPINIYNEKIFLFIWFWLAFVSIASIYGLVKWLYYFTLKSRKNFIARFLKANQIDYHSENTTHFDTDFRTFVDKYCGQDGVLLLRIVNMNMDNVIVGELICALWEIWKSPKQTCVNTVSQRADNQKTKLLDDHDSNHSPLVTSTAPTANIPEDRYVLLSPRG